jgi:hypothetical protein
MDFMAEDQNSQCSFLLSHFTQPAKPSVLDSKIIGDYYHTALLPHRTVPKLLYRLFLYSQGKTNVNPNHQNATIWFNHTV